jgi:hypothetical protein
MAIVYKGRKRRFIESEHPRNPNTGEFVEKTGGHASWLTAIANRTKGPNLGGGMVQSAGGKGLRPTVGTTKAANLLAGSHARVQGVDSSGRSTSLNGYVQGVGPVTMRQGSKRTPMLAVQMAETPSGGGANWRSTVYVPRDATVQRTRPKGEDLSRKPMGEPVAADSSAGDARLSAIMARGVTDTGAGLTRMGDEALERALADQSKLMSGLGVGAPDFTEQSAILKALRAERLRRNPALAAQLNARMEAQAAQRAADAARPNLSKIMADAGISNRMPSGTGGSSSLDTAARRLRSGEAADQVAKYLSEAANSLAVQRREMPEDMADSPEANAFKVAERILGETAQALYKLDTPRAKRDDSGMAPTTSEAPAAASGKPITNMINETADRLARDFPSASKQRPHWSGTPQPSTVEALRTIATMHEDGRLNKQNTMMALNRIAINEARSAEGGEVSKLAKAIKKAPARATKTTTPGPGLADLRDESGKVPTASKVDNAVSVLKTSNDRDEARRALDGLTVAQLKQVFTGVDRNAPAGRKADLIDKLIHTTVGNRINSRVLRGEGPDSWMEKLSTRVSKTDASVLSPAQQDVVDLGTGFSGNPYSRLPKFEALDAEGWRGLSDEQIENAKFAMRRLSRDHQGTEAGQRANKVLMTIEQARGGAPAFTPKRDADPNTREGFAATLRQLPGASLRGTAAELENGDITPREAADRVSQFLRSLAGRTMSDVNRASLADLEQRMRKADRAAFGFDRPAPTPAAETYDTITKRATLLAMLRTRNLRAKRGAPEADLRALLVEDDRKRKEGVTAAAATGTAVSNTAPRESATDAQTVESLASMKRPALLAVRRNTPGVRPLRRGASEREIAEEIVRARKAGAEAPAQPESRLAPTVSTPAPSTPAGMSPLRIDSQIERTQLLIEQTRNALVAERSKTRTSTRQSDREEGLVTQLRNEERKLRELRAEKAKREAAAGPKGEPAAPAVPAGPDTAKLDAQIAKMETKRETKRGQLGMAADKRRGRIASQRETKLRGELNDIDRELSNLKLERRKAVAAHGVDALGIKLDPAVRERMVRARLVDIERYRRETPFPESDEQARRAVANGTQPLAAVNAAVEVASATGRGPRNEEAAWKADIRRMLGLPETDVQPGDKMVEVPPTGVKFGDVISSGGLGFQVATIVRNDDGSIFLAGPGITTTSSRTIKPGEVDTVKVWRPGVSDRNREPLLDEESDLSMMARRMLQQFEDPQDRREAANRYRASQGLPEKGAPGKAEAAPDAAAGPSDTELRQIVRDAGFDPDDGTMEQWRDWLRRRDAALGAQSRPVAANEVTPLVKSLRDQIRAKELDRETEALNGSRREGEDEEIQRAVKAERDEMKRLRDALTEAERAERGMTKTRSKAYAGMSDAALDREIKAAKPSTKKLQALLDERDARAAERFRSTGKADAAPAVDANAAAIAAKEAELEAAKQRFQGEADWRPSGGMRTKSFGVRIDANLRRAGEARRDIERLERELEALRRPRPPVAPQATQADIDGLEPGDLVKLKNGLTYKVVKVNKSTVKVAVPPGMDDLMPKSKIVRTQKADVTAPKA